MKLRTWWPAIAGLVLLLAVYLLVLTSRGDDEPPASQTTAAPRPPTTARPAPPVADTREHAGKPEVATSPDEAADEDLAARAAQKPIDTSYAADPGMTAKKPKLTLDERLAEAQKHIPVIERRAELLDQEIAKLEAAGKTKEAAEQRIVANRLRDHVGALKQAIAEHREPM